MPNNLIKLNIYIYQTICIKIIIAPPLRILDIDVNIA